ncbi:MAG: response regulator, partial [Planctomycetes bacterium]|nr:response regulator [Planctomycetota bacterium]
MTRKRILIVEDDVAIRRGIVDALAFEGYQTCDVGNGDDGLQRALTGSFDLLLLDLILPGRLGLEILQEVREQRASLPVIILTARGDETDRVKGLRLGADDYVVKPFGIVELMARVQAVLRRSPERPTEISEFPLAEGTANLDRCEIVFDDGERVGLSE